MYCKKNLAHVVHTVLPVYFLVYKVGTNLGCTVNSVMAPIHIPEGLF